MSSPHAVHVFMAEMDSQKEGYSIFAQCLKAPKMSKRMQYLALLPTGVIRDSGRRVSGSALALPLEITCLTGLLPGI